MCLILFAYDSHPHYPLLVAANRDEFHTRPTAPLAFWKDAPQVLAGRDLQANGTWMGVNRSGMFAAITNYREPQHVLPNAPSRGHLVSDYLFNTKPARVYFESLLPHLDDYNGFSLLLSDETGLYYCSNRADNTELLMLTPGVYGLSNHLLNTPWFKLERGRERLEKIVSMPVDPTSDTLLHMMTDTAPAPDESLPQTGVPLEWERRLSPIFIDSPGYGTRSSTVLLVDNYGTMNMVEKTWSDQHCREFKVNQSFNNDK